MKSGFIYKLKFQKGTSPRSRTTIFFHDENLIVIGCIAALIAGTVVVLWTKNFRSFNFIDNQWLEVGWTVLPIIILIFLGLPSLELLYFLERPSLILPSVTLKATGRQWYWSYEINDTFSYDSYMEGGRGFRLLEVDNPIFLPRGQYIRLLVTGGDVIHRFCVPSLGIKMDAVPGRLNHTSFFALKLGRFYGQCSEICGANHSFMPIKLEIIPNDIFKKFF